MADVLTQTQIDQLLNSFSSGDVSVNDLEETGIEKKIRPYDFKIPKKFNKDQLKTLNIIYENYGRILASYLSGMLRSFCQIEVLHIEEQRYFEYSNALPENILVGVLNMPPLEGTSMLTVSQSIAFAIIDRLLGGQGNSYEVDREFTEIEMTLIERTVREMCRLLRDAWLNVYELRPEFIRLESNSRQNQLVSPNETVVIVMLSVKIREVEGNISFCIPYVILEPVLDNLNTRYWFTERKNEPQNLQQDRSRIRRRLAPIPVDLRAVLGTGHLTLEELMTLRPGDVIQLDQQVTDPTLVMSNREKWFQGTLGCYRSHRAVRIEKILREDGQDAES